MAPSPGQYVVRNLSAPRPRAFIHRRSWSRTNRGSFELDTSKSAAKLEEFGMAAGKRSCKRTAAPHSIPRHGDRFYGLLILGHEPAKQIVRDYARTLRQLGRRSRTLMTRHSTKRCSI